MKAAIIIVCALVALAILGAGGYWGYHKYTNHYAYLKQRTEALEMAQEIKPLIPKALGNQFPTEPGSKDMPTSDGHVVFTWSQKPASDTDAATGPAWNIHCEKFVNGDATPRILDVSISRKPGSTPGQ